MKIILGVVMIVFSLAFGSSAIAGGNDNVGNLYFSINIPDSWTYTESSDTLQARTQGLGPLNRIDLTPNEFSESLLGGNSEKQEGVIAIFTQDIDYRIKNAPLESYVKYQINNNNIQNITSQQYTTVGKEKAVRIYADESAQSGYAPAVLYLVMHDKEPYQMQYIGSPKNFEKYLPAFEQMVKSFRFVGGASSESGENLTNTKTNFSSANLTGSNSSDYTYTTPTNQKNQEELYNECVNVAGKSLCDFLFKR
jgi:hypothetical protein